VTVWLDRTQTVVVEPAAEEDLADGDALLAGFVDADHDSAWQAIDLVLTVTKKHCADGREPDLRARGIEHLNLAH
jgi:hypothetical protein